MVATSLQSRFRLITLSVVTLVFGVCIIVAFGVAYLQRHISQVMELDSVVVELHTLRILGAEYVATPSDRVRQQWQIQYKGVKARLESLPAMPAEVREVLEDMAPLFDRFATLSSGAVEPGLGRNRLAKQVAATLDMEAQRVIDWASGVSRRDKGLIVPRIATVGISAAAVLLLIAFATIATIVLTNRRVLSAVASLKEGAAEIAAGRLGVQVESGGHDEMASLAASINRMSVDLKGTCERLHERTRELEAEAAGRERMQREHARLEDQYRQAQKMEAVGLLAGGVAHDFNNVLSVIIACAGMLKNGAQGEDARESIDEILGAAQQAAELTKGLLAFGRRQAFALERADLNEISDEAAKLLKRVIGEDIELVLVPTPSPVFARVDRSAIHQVLMNLAANARDAMPRGGRLTIGVATASPGDDAPRRDGEAPPEWAVLRVSDTGVGMSRDTQDRIFEPFFTTKAKGHGTGLGLSISHGIVVQHQGQITCRSAPGAGTTFSVYLPACGAEDREAPTSEAAPSAPLASLRGTETVLVAEDDAMVMSTTTRICEANGYEVLQAHDGAEAVDLFRRHAAEIDLVLLDAIMPKMTGREAWDRIREIRPDVKGCFVSGYARDPMSGKSAVDPEVLFISKPFTAEELLTKLREALDGA